MKLQLLRIFSLLIFLISCIMFSQIREINKIDSDIDKQIEALSKGDLKKKELNQKIDSLNEIRFQRYNEIIKYFNENYSKQYFLNKSDSTRKIKPFREAFLEHINLTYLRKQNSPYSTVLHFSLTPEGKLMNINATGLNSEFNTLSVITLFKLLCEFEPYIPDRSKIANSVQNFNLPININQ